MPLSEQRTASVIEVQLDADVLAVPHVVAELEGDGSDITRLGTRIRPGVHPSAEGLALESQAAGCNSLGDTGLWP